MRTSAVALSLLFLSGALNCHVPSDMAADAAVPTVDMGTHGPLDLATPADMATAVDLPSPSGTGCGSSEWCWEYPKPQGNWLSAVFSLSPSATWMVGESGTVMFHDGRSFTLMKTGTDRDLTAVWAGGTDDVWVTGFNLILHYDGVNWQSMKVAGRDNLGGLTAVWGFAKNNVYIAASGEMFHFDGVAVTPMAMSLRTSHLWGSAPDNLWATDSLGWVGRYDGTGWKLMNTGISGCCRGVFGSSKDDVYFGGDMNADAAGNAVVGDTKRLRAVLRAHGMLQTTDRQEDAAELLRKLLDAMLTLEGRTLRVPGDAGPREVVAAAGQTLSNGRLAPRAALLELNHELAILELYTFDRTRTRSYDAADAAPRAARAEDAHANVSRFDAQRTTRSLEADLSLVTIEMNEADSFEQFMGQRYGGGVVTELGATDTHMALDHAGAPIAISRIRANNPSKPSSPGSVPASRHCITSEVAITRSSVSSRIVYGSTRKPLNSLPVDLRITKSFTPETIQVFSLLWVTATVRTSADAFTKVCGCSSPSTIARSQANSSTSISASSTGSMSST